MKRIEFIRGAAAVAGAGLLPGVSFAGEQEKLKLTRFAFMSDIHVKPGKVPEEGMARALNHIQSLKDKVDFVINGGDSIMDSLGADKQKTREQWELFNAILKNENGLPVYHCIGNHDVWGWNIRENKPDTDRLYGKQWVLETLALPNRYHSFSKGKWHFIILDSTQPNPEGGYIAYVDGEQMDWLKKELEASRDKHVCIASHIPILSICAGLFMKKTEANGDLRIPRHLMHTDFFALKNLFRQHPNIKACLSGHIHLQDEVDYLGIKYYCNGAVSGNWWNGAFHEFNPAYAVFEFSDDGSTKRKMVSYGVG